MIRWGTCAAASHAVMATPLSQKCLSTSLRCTACLVQLRFEVRFDANERNHPIVISSGLISTCTVQFTHSNQWLLTTIAHSRPQHTLNNRWRNATPNPRDTALLQVRSFLNHLLAPRVAFSQVHKCRSSTMGRFSVLPLPSLPPCPRVSMSSQAPCRTPWPSACPSCSCTSQSSSTGRRATGTAWTSSTTEVS